MSECQECDEVDRKVHEGETATFPEIYHQRKHRREGSGSYRTRDTWDNYAEDWWK